MSAVNLIFQLRQSGFSIRAFAGGILIAPVSGLSDEARHAIAENRPAILRQLEREAEQPPAPLHADDESAIRKWLGHIDETDPEIIAHVLHQCRTQHGALACSGGESP